MNAELSEASIHQWQFKTPAMRRMTIAACRLALERGPREFSALDLPSHGAEAHGGSGIAGSVFRQLIEAGIIAAVGYHDGTTFFPKVEINAAGNKIGVYRLANGGLCRALLRVHDPHVALPPKQLELV
jgi:hypothetical protein